MRTQGRHTRARLLDAGMQVLRERGYHAARVDDVVRRAGVSHGTFYLYFANKEDLFRALALQCAEEMTALAGSLGPVEPGASGVAELRRWSGEFVATYRAYGVVIRAWMERQVGDRELVRLGARTFASIAAALVERIEAANPGLRRHDAELRAAALLAMVERLTYYVTSRELEVDDGAVAATLAVVAHRGFFAAGGATSSRLRLARA
jgi:AcrR family transcriptional regulator